MVPGNQVDIIGKAKMIAVDTASNIRNQKHPLKISPSAVKPEQDRHL
jgi:hypothetical protein